MSQLLQVGKTAQLRIGFFRPQPDTFQSHLDSTGAAGAPDGAESARAKGCLQSVSRDDLLP